MTPVVTNAHDHEVNHKVDVADYVVVLLSGEVLRALRL